jgi:hypothetical protein
MKTHRNDDLKFLMDLPKERLIELLFTHIRNLWSEDGLYFLGIEKRFGTEPAIDIDCEVWAVMGKLEARRLKQTLGIDGGGLAKLFEMIKHSSWWLYLEEKEYELTDSKLLIRNNKCRVQQTRVEKGLGEFGCKPVRNGFLNNFLKEFNNQIKVNCRLCPPDKHPENLVCEWEFTLD